VRRRHSVKRRPVQGPGQSTATPFSDRKRSDDKSRSYAFIVAPSGMTPSLAKRRSAMRSLRAKATIMILATRPRAWPTRSRNHCASALSGWNRNQNQARSTTSARSRRLPSLPMPCSRCMPPLANGVPASPA
jgi:hypothetical protein